VSAVSRKADLQHGDEVAVWMAKSRVKGSRYGAGNNAAPTGGGSGCWCRARVSVFEDWERRKVALVLLDGRAIPLPALIYVQTAPFDLHAPAPRR